MQLLLAHSHANTLGGGERAVVETATRLAMHHQVGLLLGGFDRARTYAEFSSLPATHVGRLQWPFLRPTAEAIITNSFGANLLALRNGSRVGYWVHSTRSIFLGPQTSRADLQARRMLDRLAIHRTRRLIANSHYTANRLRALYGRDADDVVYPGVDLSQFHPTTEHNDYAISVGRLSPEKGLDRLFEIWRDLPDVPLHIVGQGDPHFVRLLRATAPRSIVWRGRLTGRALVEAYQGAAMAVFSSHGEEFGIAPLEAMASGRPVVAWQEGGLPETVIDGQTGYLVTDAVTFRQRVRLLRHDRRQRQRLGAAARARAEEFSWERTARALEAVCQQLAPAR